MVVVVVGQVEVWIAEGFRYQFCFLVTEPLGVCQESGRMGESFIICRIRVFFLSFFLSFPFGGEGEDGCLLRGRRLWQTPEEEADKKNRTAWDQWTRVSRFIPRVYLDFLRIVDIPGLYSGLFFPGDGEGANAGVGGGRVGWDYYGTSRVRHSALAPLTFS